MSKENVKLFFNKVNEDEKLQEELSNLTAQHHEELVNEIIEIGAEYGYTFDKKDMSKSAEEIMMESGELSETEMEAVAGGSGGLSNMRLTTFGPLVDEFRLRLKL